MRQWHDEDGAASELEAYVSEQPSGSRSPSTRRAPARGANGAGPSEEQVLAAVRELDSGAGAAVAELGAKLGAAAAGVKKAVDALVTAGRLVEKKKRPRLVSVAIVGAGEP